MSQVLTLYSTPVIYLLLDRLRQRRVRHEVRRPERMQHELELSPAE